MNFGVRKRRRRSRKERRRGRRKGTKNKLNPEVTRKLGDATLHYAQGYFDKAICLLHEVIRLAPNLSDPFHTLGLIYSAMDDNKRAMIFYMIAAHLNPKDASLWKLLLAKSIEYEDKKQAYYCLNKAIVADPEDINLHSTRAMLYVELEKYQKAAESYEQIARLCPDNIEFLQKAAQLCKSLSSLRRYSSALGIVKISLKLDALPVQIKKELRTIGAQLEALIADPAHGWDLVRDFVSRDPYSFSDWNHCYKVILRMNQLSRRNKLLHSMRVKHKDSIPPILITDNQFTMISQRQTAAREYLHAYKLMPDNPLINLCGGTALINLSLGLRLQNKHQTFLQGLAFLYNNLRLCGDSQEALYNIARAYHHVGLVSLAAQYYEKALTTCEKDYPIPTLPYENQNATKIKMPGYCDLRREAAYNLHLIYKQSGAFDLARQVLKYHLVL